LILEVAEIHIHDGEQTAFEQAVHQSIETYISVTEGYIDSSLQRSVEEPTRYLLLVQWTTIEAHMVNFRESERFPQHRALIGPYFARPPHIQHFVLC
jgi:heme-degrading monooxygenase HmoA